MKVMKQCVRIQADIERVFEYASDWRHWHEWFHGFSDCHPTTKIQRSTGARYQYKVRVMGLPATVETEIHDFTENHGWTGIGTKGLPHKTHWLFEPTDDGTLFTYTVEGHVPILLIGRLLEALILEPEWNKILDRSLNNIKEKLES